MVSTVVAVREDEDTPVALSRLPTEAGEREVEARMRRMACGTAVDRSGCVE